jgi:hypothetical protein
MVVVAPESLEHVVEKEVVDPVVATGFVVIFADVVAVLV